MTNLSDILDWSHHLLKEALRPGALAVDLTAGNGHDTLFLAQKVRPGGRVLAFDVQTVALEKTAERLLSAGYPVHRMEPGSRRMGPEPGVWLAADCHSQVEGYLPGKIHAAAANLGYLPGGAKHLITRTETTLIAISRVLTHLTEGGRLCVVSYPGHEGGREEGEKVEELFSGLAGRDWDFLKVEIGNRSEAPRLLAVQKRQKGAERA